MQEGLFILAAGALLGVTVAASVAAQRLRLPALILFLLIGMVAGSDGAGVIQLHDHDLARQIGTGALALILFDGGLGTHFGSLRPVLRPAVALATAGTVVTALVTGLAAAALLNISILSGLLLGAIMSSTDGAAVFALLRGSRLRHRLVHTLEGEAGMNDPVAVLLVVGFVDWIRQPDYGLIDMLGLFVGELAIGAIAGILAGRAGGELLRRVTLPGPGLYPVATVATAAFAYGAADSMHGSGFLAVYLAGLTFMSSHPPAQMTIAVFHEGVAWLAQAGLFLTLGLLVDPARLGAVLIPGIVLAVFVVCVARPVAVVTATALDSFTPADRMLLSWAGLRGGVPVVLATLPVIAGVDGSARFFDVVFVVVVLSTLVQGMTIEPLARVLRLLENQDDGYGVPVLEQLPWGMHHGDPAHPVMLGGLRVVEHLRSRIDAAGALVALADGRHAITGPTVTVGSADALARYAAQRLVRAQDDGERAWWHELARTLRGR
jgi:cell volume regulation protein A